MDKVLNFDFSGGPTSWFDFWHTHADWDGKGNKDWHSRKRYLSKLLKTFNELRERLSDYPHDFQLWIMINEKDSADDCVYIHTKNPNGDNFPLKVKADNTNTMKNKGLREFVDSLDFQKVKIGTSTGHIYYLYDKGTGISLV